MDKYTFQEEDPNYSQHNPNQQDNVHIKKKIEIMIKLSLSKMILN